MFIFLFVLYADCFENDISLSVESMIRIIFYICNLNFLNNVLLFERVLKTTSNNAS